MVGLGVNCQQMPGVETVADIGHNSEGGVCGDMWSVDVLGPNSCPEGR